MTNPSLEDFGAYQGADGMALAQRGFRKEWAQFLVYARGSRREMRGRYDRRRRGLATLAIDKRRCLCEDISTVVTAPVRRLQATPR